MSSMQARQKIAYSSTISSITNTVEQRKSFPYNKFVHMQHCGGRKLSGKPASEAYFPLLDHRICIGTYSECVSSVQLLLANVVLHVDISALL